MLSRIARAAAAPAVSFTRRGLLAPRAISSLLAPGAQILLASPASPPSSSSSLRRLSTLSVAAFPLSPFPSTFPSPSAASPLSPLLFSRASVSSLALSPSLVAPAPVRAFSASPTSSSSSTGSNGQSQHNQQQQQQQQQGEEQPKEAGGIRGLITKYGPLAIGVYIAVYLGFLFAIFIFVSSGVGLSAEQIIARVKAWDVLPAGWIHRVDNMAQTTSPTVLNFAAAWLLTKLTEPVRFLLTGLIVKRIADRRRGGGGGAGPSAKALLPLLGLPASALPGLTDDSKTARLSQPGHRFLRLPPSSTEQ